MLADATFNITSEEPMNRNAIRTRRLRRPRPASPVADCMLPHERDESPADPAHAGAPHAEIAIAERDLREGQVDTDNYTRLRDVGNAGLRKRR